MSSNEFFLDGGDHTRIAFWRDGVGKAARAWCSIRGPGRSIRCRRTPDEVAAIGDGHRLLPMLTAGRL